MKLTKAKKTLLLSLINDHFINVTWERKGIFKSVNYYKHYDEEKKTLTVTFQESDSLFDWMMNLIFIPIRYRLEMYRVHLGFYMVWKSIEGEMEELLETYKDATTINAFGHSHGGALIHFFDKMINTKFKDRKVKVNCFTTGSPRVVKSVAPKSKFKDDFDNVISIINGNDPVPKVPFRWMGYRDAIEQCVYVGSKKESFKETYLTNCKYHFLDVYMEEIAKL